MGLSSPWDDFLDIIDLQTVTKFPWVNPMGLSFPMAESIDSISLQIAKIN